MEAETTGTVENAANTQGTAQGETGAPAANDGKPEKTFTQAELDSIIQERIAKEKKSIPSKEELDAYRQWKEEHQTAEEKQAEAMRAEQEKRTDAESRAAALEAKLTCMEKNVKPDCVEDVQALAARLVDEKTDLGKAVDKVLEKYPQFKASAPGVTTGTRTSGKALSEEAAYLENKYGNNPYYKKGK